MRISTSQIFRQSVDAMLEKQRELSKTELQVASGKRILNPSDDPSASVRILRNLRTLNSLPFKPTRV